MSTPTPRTSGAASDLPGPLSGTDAATRDTPPGDSVELRVPADPAYLAVVRTAAAGLAARLDLTLDEIEDLRIAVDELTFALMGEKSGDAVLTLHYTAMPGAVEIEGSCATNDTAFVVSDLSRTIIGGVTSEYEVGEADGQRRFRLVKRTRT